MDGKSPDEKFAKIRQKFNLNLTSILKYSTPKVKLYIAIGTILSIISGAIFPAFMFIMARVAFTFILGNFDTSIIYLMLGLALFAFFVNAFSAFVMELVSHEQSDLFKRRFFKAIVRQDMNWFNSIDTGTLVTRLEENLTLIREALGTKITQVAMFISMLTFSIIFSFFSHASLTAVLLISYPLMMGAMFLTSQAIVRSQKISLKAYEAAGSIAEEATLLVRMVRANNAQDRLREWYTRAIEYAEKVVIRSSVGSSLGIGFLMMTLLLIYSLGLYYGGRIIVNFMEENPGEQYQADKILRVLMMMSTSSFLLGQVAPLLLNISKGINAAADLSEIIDRVPDIDIYDESGIKDTTIIGNIEFKNVSFTYPNTNSQIFDKINLKFNAGETIALVGPSGIGKSTITSLIQRFYDPDEGTIYLDGAPLKSYNVQFLRKNISIISQQPRLFSMTIRENIQFGNPGIATYEDIIAAAKNAYAHDFIKTFPNKYDTPAGEGGSQLSGGQMQRIAIARAMIRKPALFILDEATAALDVESEKLVQQAFDNLINDRISTKLIVAHRLSTIKNADRIFVLGRVDGSTKIVEEGNHATLSEIPDGIYHNMMKTQMFEIDSQNSTSVSESQAIIKSEISIQRSMSVASNHSIMSTYTQNAEEQSNTFKNKFMKYFKWEKKPEELKITRAIVIKNILKNPTSIVILLIASVGMGLTFPSIAFLITAFITSLTGGDIETISNSINTVSLVALLLGLLAGLSGFGQFFNMQVSGQKLITKLRRIIFDHLMAQPITFYDNPKNSVGHISSVLAADVNLINQGYINNTGVILQMATTFLFAFTYAIITDWLFGISMLIPFLILIPATMTRGKKIVKRPQSDKTDSRSSAFLLHESLITFNSVASYSLQDMLYERYEKLLAKEQGRPIREAIFYGISIGIAAGGLFAINALGFYIGSKAIQDNPDKGLEIARSIFLIMYASRSINQNAVFTADMNKARASELKVAELLNENYLSSIAEEEIDISPRDFKGDININNLRFIYPLRGLPVYKSLTCNIGAGQMVAFVGESGAGKSTIVQLVEKFYDYTQQHNNSQNDGEYFHNFSMEEIKQMITIDGVPLCKISAHSLRKITGYVSQDPSIFNTTITENIRMGKPDATMNEIELACKAANIHDFIMDLPDKYETHTGRLGSKLSGGQKQRVAIARAIIRNPKLLILDEATSALDAQGEATVQKALDNLLSDKSRTSIVIAHRLSTIVNADKIIVLKSEGNSGSVIAEHGTHAELIAHDGIYKRMLETALA